MADGLSDIYQDLLTGSYDCVDRIVGADLARLRIRHKFSIG